MTRLSGLAVLVVVASVAGGVSQAQASRLPAFKGCAPVPARMRPAEIVVACADVNLFFSGLRWSHWGTATAVARGRGNQNDCQPYCAAGHWRTFPVEVTLSRPETCRADSVLFTRLSYAVVGAVPKGVARHGTVSAPFTAGSACR